MTSQDRTAISKRLSYVLRHRPDSIGIQLTEAGWTDVEQLLDGLALHGLPLSLYVLKEVVETNPKRRFEFSPDGSEIRARQGHSVDVDLGYEPVAPPRTLFHGTPEVSVESILLTGLERRRRHHVHMSTDRHLMLDVARRRGAPALLKIDAGRMHDDGVEFFVTGNDVWLTEHVPPSYLSRASDLGEMIPPA